jgi:dihydroorotase
MLSRRQFNASAALLCTGAPSLFAKAEYDLVIKDGRVIDASQNLDRTADVAIKDGRIVAVKPGIPSSKGIGVIHAEGKLVTPGLIDIHVHVAEKDMPPSQCLSQGVTSLIDGGSRGADNVEELVRIAQAAPNHVRILLNIARRGIALGGGPGELLDIQNADVQAARRAAEYYRDWIVGIKARLSRSVAGDSDLEALRRARQVADPLKIPIMVHIGDTASPLPDILALLRPGDIVTHIYAPPPHGIMDDDGRALPQVREARRRGVLFDVGNGRTAHWTWEVAESAIQRELLPDTISSDLTAAGLTDQVFSLATVLSKFLLLGMPVEQVIACATRNAARANPALKSYGSLRVGASADVAVFDLQQGDFEFVDNYKGTRKGTRKLVPFAVVASGKRVL